MRYAVQVIADHTTSRRERLLRDMLIVTALRAYPNKSKSEIREEIDALLAADPAKGEHYRVTEVKSDSRVATCYMRENADMIVQALNSTEATWCHIHQHFQWCGHNGGVLGPTGWGPAE